MKRYVLRTGFFLTLICFCFNAIKGHALVNILAAENFYGNTAEYLGGPYVRVHTILKNPAQDPHLFQLKPSTIQQAIKADILIYNGAGYDSWMQPLVKSQLQRQTRVIEVASLVNFKIGKNPHIWYEPNTMPAVAQKLTSDLIQLDPEHKSFYQQQWNNFQKHYQIIFQIITELRQRFKNKPVIATEPLFNYMTESIGLNMHAEGFQNNIMNDISPSVSQIKSFEDDLRSHSVCLLIYNKQVVNPLTKRMHDLAESEKISLLAVSELLPQGMDYIGWIVKELKELATDLEGCH